MKKGTRFKHLTWNDRLIIERMLLKGFSKQEIADVIGCNIRTIYNEMARAKYEHTNSDLTIDIRYSPDKAHQDYRRKLKARGRVAKLAKDRKQMAFIEKMIIEERYSPKAILLHIKKYNLKFSEKITSVNTIYNAIRKNLAENIDMNYLPCRGKRIKRKQRVTVQKKVSPGISIEKRPKEVAYRNTFGHWEMDCVVGKNNNKKTLLVITERMTRFEIIEPMKKHTASEVVKALNRIEKRFKSDFFKIFKSITVDNGHEFSDFEGMGKALYRVGKRTEIYYCHPYSPHERGTNENQNILIRRFFPKGSDFDKTINRNDVKDTQYWLNTYPRGIFNGKCSLDLFNRELKKLRCKLLM